MLNEAGGVEGGKGARDARKRNELFEAVDQIDAEIQAARQNRAHGQYADLTAYANHMELLTKKRESLMGMLQKVDRDEGQPEERAAA